MAVGFTVGKLSLGPPLAIIKHGGSIFWALTILDRLDTSPDVGLVAGLSPPL
jgi:hypothetical protein